MTNSNSNITFVSAVEVISNGLLVAVLKYVTYNEVPDNYQIWNNRGCHQQLKCWWKMAPYQAHKTNFQRYWTENKICTMCEHM